MSIIVDALYRHGQQTPEATALLTKEGTVTYGSLAERVTRFANELAGTGKHTIGIQLDNGLDWVVADLAIMKLGLTAVPIPAFFTVQQINHLIETASIDLMLTDKDAPGGNEWQQVTVDSTCAYLREAQSVTSGAKITFTSGSSGTPKGVILDQQTIDNTTSGIVSALTPLSPKRHLCVLPLATLLENIAGLYAPIVNGSEVQIPPPEEVGLQGASLDIDRFTKLLAAAEADSMILVPQLLMAVTTLIEFGLLKLENYKMIAVGGGRISKALLDRAAAQDLPVFEGYGLSECCSVLTLNLPGQHKPGSVGKCLPHTQLRISEKGEIEVKAPVMNGYLGDKAERSDWYATGDLGYIDVEGYVYITGRERNVFITAYGRNVNPEWVEAALSQQAAIAQAVAYGEGREHNLALLWLRFEQTPEQLEELIQQVNRELPDYAQVHEYLVMTEAFPEDLTTDNGRVKRAPLLARYETLIEKHYQLTPDLSQQKRAL